MTLCLRRNAAFLAFAFAGVRRRRERPAEGGHPDAGPPEGLRVPEHRPRDHGRPHRRHRGRPVEPVAVLRRDRLGRNPQDDERRHDVRAGLRRSAGSSIGDLAIAPSDPQIVYVGTGEPNNRQSSSWGNGVYKTLDGGNSWPHLGLAESHHIARIVVHPRIPTSSTSRRSAGSGARARSAGSTRRRTAARPGRTRSSSTRTPASSTWRSIRRAPTRSTPRPTTAAHAVRLQRRRTRQRALEDARRRCELDEAHEGPARGRHRPHRRRGLRTRAQHRLRARRAREGGRRLPLGRPR